MEKSYSTPEAELPSWVSTKCFFRCPNLSTPLTQSEKALYRALFRAFSGSLPGLKKRAYFAFKVESFDCWCCNVFCKKKWKKCELQSCCLRTVLRRLILKMTKTNPSFLYIIVFIITWFCFALCKRSSACFFFFVNFD